jgi:putative transposase
MLFVPDHSGSPRRNRRFVIGALDRIVLRGREYRWDKTEESGHFLFAVHAPGEQIVEGFSHAELDEAHRNDEFSVDPGFYSEAKIRSRWLAAGAISLMDLTGPEQRIVMRRQEWCDGILRYLANTPEAKRTEDGFKTAIAVVHPIIVARDVARSGDDKAARCDRKVEMYSPPCVRTIRRWLKAYEAGGMDPIALRDGHCNSGNVMSTIAPAVRKIMIKHANGFASIEKPTVKKQYGEVCKDLDKLNESLPEDDRHPKPAKATFAKFIKKMPAIRIYAGRHGPAAAQRKFFIVGEGSDAVRAGQRIQMDGHKAQIITLAPAQAFLGSLSKATIEKFKKERLVVHVALDVASRCVLAARLSSSENKETALATLHMAVSDKTAYALAAGCESDWPMAARPGMVETDTGSAWHSDLFRSAVANLRSTLRNGPVGAPQMRGHVERWFGGLDTGFLHDYTGRTFGSIEEKGDYDAGAQASMLSEEFGPLLVKYIVDVYHRREHPGLNNMTPYDKWFELQERYGIVPPPGANERRAIFGVDLKRSLDQRGVRVGGIHYQNEAIQAYRRQFGDGKIPVKIDCSDMGQISCYLSDAWHAVPAIRGNFAGVSLAQWSEAVKDLKRRNQLKSKLSEDIVNRALAELSAAGSRFANRLDISDPVITADGVVNLERGLLVGFDIHGEDGDGTDADRGGDLLGGAIPIVGNAKSASASEALPNPAKRKPSTAKAATKAERKPKRKLEDRR